VLVSLANGGLNALDEDCFRVLGAIVLRQGLRIHLIARNVVGISLKERAEVGFRRGEVAFAHAFKRNAVTREGVTWILCEEFFKFLTAGFLLFGHRGVSYYTRERKESKAVVKRAEMSEPAKRKKTESEAKQLRGKYVSESASEMAEVVLPAQTNALGKLLGGHVMHMVDIVAAMAACRHANSYMVTASVDYIDFRNPVNLGEIVMLKAQVNRVFHTSLEVGVEVLSENILTGARKQTTTAYVTFVAIDERTRLPKPVPPLIVKTGAERRRWREAAKRREIRLVHRQGRKG